MEKKKKSTFFTLTIWLRESFGLALCLRWCGAGRCPGTSGAVGTRGDAATKCPGGTLQPQVDGARLGPSVWSVVLLEFFMRLPGGRAGGGFGGAFVALALLVCPSLGCVPWARGQERGVPPWGAAQNQTQMLKPIGQVMGGSWELGRNKLRKQRGFICCNPRSSPTLAGFQ